MSHWNYRLCKKRLTKDAVQYCFHEVYYDDNGKINGWTEDSVEPYYCEEEPNREVGDDPVQMISEVLDAFKKALDKPVLDLD